MTFAQRRNRLTTHFSERIPVVKRRMTVVSDAASECVTVTLKVQVLCPLDFIRTTAARSVTASGATHPTTHHHRTGVSHQTAAETSKPARFLMRKLYSTLIVVQVPIFNLQNVMYSNITNEIIFTCVIFWLKYRE